MALITDPDNLTQGVEVTINTSTKKIALSVAGNLSTDGVTLQALYSFLKEEWLSDSLLIPIKFPLLAITSRQFELINGWDFEDLTTKQLIRNGGWALKDSSGVSLEEWAGIVSLGNIGSGDQVYYQQSSGGAATNVVLTGPANQAVQIFGDAAHGNFSRRSFFKIFVREYQKSYSVSQLSDIGVTSMTYEVYSFPLSNAADLKITHNDAAVSTDAPYDGISIEYLAGTGFTAWATATPYVVGNVVSSGGRWFICTANHTSGGANIPPNGSFWDSYSGERQIGSTYYAFNSIIEGNDATAEQIYEKVQYLLRQNSDIDTGSELAAITGKTANDLLEFVGDTLKTSAGVFIDAFSTLDQNRLVFRDYSGIERTFPFLALLTLQFNDNIVNDTSAKFVVYFTNDDAGDDDDRDFGTVDAIIVQDTDEENLVGLVSGQPSIQIAFDYDGNVQRGAASAGTDAPITVVVIGLGTAQYVFATGTIARSNANVVSLTAALERNYSNP